jgi:hypothetical protein
MLFIILMKRLSRCRRDMRILTSLSISHETLWIERSVHSSCSEWRVPQPFLPANAEL